MSAYGIDTSPSEVPVGLAPATPEQWLDWLYSKLARRKANYQIYGQYYDGFHQRLMFAQVRHFDQFHNTFDTWRDNFCGMIIDSVNERLFIDGFRMTDEPDADKDARDIWQRNFMDSESNAAMLDAMIQGVSYAVVWADKKGDPTITIESAENFIVQYKPGSRQELDAAAKFYYDDWGRQWVTLWLPDRVYTFSKGTYTWEAGDASPNPLGVIPVVPISNRSRLLRDPVSDLHVVIPIQDAVNKTVADALVASEYAAWPQRYVTGLEIVEDDHGNPVEPFKVAVDKLLQAEDPNAKFGQFEAANLSNYVVLVEMLVQHMASISRIPFHYFINGGGQIPSGESITAAEAGLIAKTRERMLHFGEAWEQVMRLCFAVKGDDRAEAWSAETIWRDPENRTEAQHMDALLKLQMIGVPRDQLLSDAGYTPQQIERFADMREQDAKAAMELAAKYPMPTQEPDGDEPPGNKPAGSPGMSKKAQETAKKPPQGNSGNQARKQNPAK
ncbi:phage portal protein [Streptomyces scabiei]|uniref:phage portal protein n=1 Tax=Streptomyces scabiei TaxID=1930 RepID=UPI00378CBAB3